MIVKKLIVGLLQANCYLLADEDARRVAIIDPGGDGEKISTAIEREGWEPEVLIDTHGHIDHIAANAFLKKKYGVPLLIHEGDAPMISDPALNLAIPGLGEVDFIPPDRLLNDGDEIGVGSLRLQVIATPGHSLGGVSLLAPRTDGPDVVFTGDTLFAGGVGRTDFPGGSMGVLLDSIRNRLLILPDETIVCPGHGPDSTIGREKESNQFL